MFLTERGDEMQNLNGEGQEEKMDIQAENEQLEKENMELEKENAELEAENTELEKENAEIENENDILEKANTNLLKENRTNNLKIAKLAGKVTILTVILCLIGIYIFFTDVVPSIAIVDPTITEAHRTKFEDHKYIGEIGLTSEDPDKFEIYSQRRAIDIKGVPDNGGDDYAKWNLKPGCGPLATINIVEYWAQNGYENLVTKDKPETYKIIKKYIKSFPTDEGEGTYSNELIEGLEQYAIDCGYTHSTADSEYNSNDMWENLKVELEHNRPVAAAIKVMNGDSINHLVVITGVREYVVANENGTFETKRYIVINDGWSVTKGSSFAKYDQGFTQIITFNPKR